MAVLALAASFILRGDGAGETPKIAAPAETPLLPLVIDYEKVVADNSNIFRYRMALSPARTLSVEIDDLGEDRHIRKDTVVTEESATRLARQLERAGLFALEPLAPGVSADGSLARQAAAVALGGRATSICAENRIPPPAFAAVCELLETFGRNELGIWAIQYPAERLVELALECQTRAANLFAQRDISHGNIHAALRSCREGVFYLETVEPKPEFYADMLNLLGDAEAELERRCDERRFRADRAINLKDWNAAAAELRVLRELVPDEGDPRNADATRKLLDVENRIQKER